jgi:hypothetical protein
LGRQEALNRLRVRPDLLRVAALAPKVSNSKFQQGMVDSLESLSAEFKTMSTQFVSFQEMLQQSLD